VPAASLPARGQLARYLPQPAGPPRVHLLGIPKGYRGTLRTAEHMGRLIREGAKDFYVRQKAIDILLERGIQPKDYLGEIRALFEWVQSNVRYTKDPFQVELLHAPRRMLQLRAGDCDDMSILLGAMLEAVGHPSRLVLIGPDPARPDLFSHVYLEARHQGRWIPLDPTMPHPMGWAPQASNKQVIAVRPGPDAEEHGGPDAMSHGYGLAQDDPTRVVGAGAPGEVRQGPDGNLYQWVHGADGLGNPVGFWNMIPAIASAALPLLQNVLSPQPAAAPAPPALPAPAVPGLLPAQPPPPGGVPAAGQTPGWPAPTEQGVVEVLRGVEQFGLPRRDPRVRGLWYVLRQRGLLGQSPWLRAVLILIWRDGLQPRQRPKTARKMAEALRGFDLLPAAADDLARGRRRRVGGRARRAATSRRPRRPRSLRLSEVPVLSAGETWR
jgi:hypothetical protein